MSRRSISSGDLCMKMGTYCKTEGIIGLTIEELLPKVSRFRCKRNECAINHAKTGSPGMARHLTSHLHWAIEWPGHGAAKRALMIQWVELATAPALHPLCNCIHRGSTTKMAELKQSNGKLGWDWYLLILRVIPEARAILNEG